MLSKVANVYRYGVFSPQLSLAVMLNQAACRGKYWQYARSWFDYARPF